MAKKELRAFEFVIILQPKYDKDNEKVEDGKLVENGLLLATDDEQATILVGRKIPEELLEQLERVTLGVRPF